MKDRETTSNYKGLWRHEIQGLFLFLYRGNARGRARGNPNRPTDISGDFVIFFFAFVVY